MTLHFDLSLWIVSLIILLIVLYGLWRGKRPLPYLVSFAIFWIYSMLVLKAILFPIPIGMDIQIMSGKISFLPRVNLVPLDFQSLSRNSIFDIIQNILLTIPFGFGIHFIKTIRKWDYVWVFLLGGVALEVFQLIAVILFKNPYRVFDINDIIMNSVGVFIGIVFFKLFAWFYKKITQKNKRRPKGLFLYMLNVINR